MVSHPYAPQSIELHGFVPNFLSGFQIVLIYAASCILLCIIVGNLQYIHCADLSLGLHKLLTKGKFHVGKIFDVQGVEKLLMYWFAITGVTHVVLEAYYVITPKFYTVDYPMYLAEVCKFLTHICKNTSCLYILL